MQRIITLFTVVLLLTFILAPASAEDSPPVIKARFWDALESRQVQCHLCPRNCLMK